MRVPAVSLGAFRLYNLYWGPVVRILQSTCGLVSLFIQIRFLSLGRAEPAGAGGPSFSCFSNFCGYFVLPHFVYRHCYTYFGSICQWLLLVIINVLSVTGPHLFANMGGILHGLARALPWMQVPVGLLLGT